MKKTSILALSLLAVWFCGTGLKGQTTTQTTPAITDADKAELDRLNDHAAKLFVEAIKEALEKPRSSNMEKYAEVVQGHRAALTLSERVLGAEHHDTLESRMNLVNSLRGMGKQDEAVKELRELLKAQEHALGVEHPKVLQSCFYLAVDLETQKNLKEALELAQRAEAGWQKLQGTDHGYFKRAKMVRERIEAKLKAK